MRNSIFIILTVLVVFGLLRLALLPENNQTGRE
jgi:hypothetical protein